MIPKSFLMLLYISIFCSKVLLLTVTFSEYSAASNQLTELLMISGSFCFSLNNPKESKVGYSSYYLIGLNLSQDNNKPKSSA